MLIIARRKGDRIAIGDDIEIVVTEITKKGVRLGISAPASVVVLRGEVRDAVADANRSAASSDVELPLEGAPGAGVSALASLGVNRSAPKQDPVRHDDET